MFHVRNSYQLDIVLKLLYFVSALAVHYSQDSNICIISFMKYISYLETKNYRTVVNLPDPIIKYLCYIIDLLDIKRGIS